MKKTLPATVVSNSNDHQTKSQLSNCITHIRNYVMVTSHVYT